MHIFCFFATQKEECTELQSSIVHGTQIVLKTITATCASCEHTTRGHDKACKSHTHACTLTALPPHKLGVNSTKCFLSQYWSLTALLQLFIPFSEASWKWLILEGIQCTEPRMRSKNGCSKKSTFGSWNSCSKVLSRETGIRFLCLQG